MEGEGGDLSYAKTCMSTISCQQEVNEGILQVLFMAFSRLCNYDKALLHT